MTYNTYKDKAIHIFDYDYTLYNGTDTREYELYIKEKLTELKAMGKCLAIASHNSCAEGYLREQSFGHFFDMYICEYPRKKCTMVTEILDKMGYKPEDAIFYDDLKSNIEDVSKLGVVSYLVDRDGIVFENIFIDENNKLVSFNDVVSILDSDSDSDREDVTYKLHSDNDSYSESENDSYSESENDNEGDNQNKDYFKVLNTL